MNDGTVVQEAVSNPAPQTNENLLTQDKANYLITKAKESAYEKGKQEALAQMQANMQSQNAGLTSEQLLEILDKRDQEKANQYAARQILGDFGQKLNQGKKDYADFEDQVGIFNLAESPAMIRALNDLPNTTDVAYEMSQNPEKFAMVQILLEKNQGPAAAKLLNKISKSIEDNKKAASDAKTQKVSEPLKQLKPSTTVVDTGKMTVKDLKKMLKR